METILIGVTALSLTVSVVLGVLLARVLRDERRRSDARVNLLTRLAAADDPRLEPRTAYSDLDVEPDAARPVATSALFAEHDASSPWPRRVASAAAVAAVVALVGVGWNMFQHRQPSAPTDVVSTAPQPLELLSLTHTRQSDGLTITGLVQNPRTARAIANVQATAMVFGSDGSLIATGRSPLDFSALEPGTESPFVIRVAVKGAARYRVAFQRADGQPLAHVDRRTLDAVARKELP